MKRIGNIHFKYETSASNKRDRFIYLAEGMGAYGGMN